MTLSHRRLLTQGLTLPIHGDPAPVVACFGAMQAQDYLFAKWSLAQRVTQATDASIESAFAAGAFLRTHVMRPTWFFVSPADIRWMLMLTAGRVHQSNGTYYRKTGIDDAVKLASLRVIGKALDTSPALTRDELYLHLRAANLVDATPGLRGVYLLMHAELEQLICSGPMQGKHQTYALLDRRAPNARTLRPDEALVELARRFFSSHGPATRRDFARWSGLTLADSDRALAELKHELRSESIEADRYWFADGPAQPAATELPLRAFLLSGYDEYLNGYASWSHATERAASNRTKPESYLLRNQMAIIAGQIVGVWGREVRNKSVRVEITPFFALSDAESAAFDTAVQALGAYHDRPGELTIASVPAQ